MAKIVILGAGLTGISTAYHLEKQGFFDYKIFEKENEIGGLCRSVKQDGFTFDFTGHLLHINDEYFGSLIDNIVGKENLNSIHRRSFVYSSNVYTHYPFQINLFGLPADIVTECIEGFINKPKTKKDPKSFYKWAINNFGEGFAKYFFIPFQNKIFDYNIKKISSSWTGRFVPQTSLRQIIQGAIKEPEISKVGYNSQFFYPKKDGIIFWVQKLADQLINPINTNFCTEKIDLKNKVITFTNGHQEPFEHIVNTIPLDNMLDMLKENSSTNFQKVSKNLICNSVVNFNLGIARENLTDKHWIYFPETKYPFYRVGFPHNFSSALVPDKHSSLYGEFSYINKSEKEINSMLNKAIDETKNLFNLTDKEIVTKKIIHIPRAYVVYNFWREKNLQKLLNELEQNSIYNAGRYGQWKYSSMQEAVIDGKKVAEQILNINKLIVPAKKIDSFQDNTKSREKHVQNS